jgi:glutamate carboxypeptidase
MTRLNAVSAYIKEHTAAMFKLLEEMVLLQSSSHNKAGVDRVAALIATAFQPGSVSCETVKQALYGNHLLVRTGPADKRNRQVLLVGHMDTVFPEDTDFNWYKEDTANSYGPGVADMKGGLVAGIFALKALAAGGLLENIPVTFIFNSDEEIGSGSSRELIRQEARNSAFAFVLEGGGLNGEIVTGRKGNLSITLTVKGQAGHAAFAGPDKGSAILELARKTIAFESLNEPEKGLSANVGIVEGGIGSNTVAETAVAKVDFRFPTEEAYRFLKKKIGDIALCCSVPNTESSYKILSTRPPMPVCDENKKLFGIISDTAAKVGIKVVDEYRPGVSDANLIAAEKVPVVDGLGPAGAEDHSRNEYIIKKTLPQRSILIACSIVNCWEKFRENVR